MTTSFFSNPIHRVQADLIALLVPGDETAFRKFTQDCTKEFPEAKSLLQSGDFKGKKESTALIYTNGSAAAPRLLLIGIGKQSDVKPETLRRCGAVLAKTATGKKLSSVALRVPAFTKMPATEVIESLTEGVMLTAYKFDKYFSDKDAKKNNTVSSLTFCLEDKKSLHEAKSAAHYAGIVAEAVITARNLANAPNNEVYPEVLAARVRELAKHSGFKVTVFEKKKIEALKMHGLLAVNQGSSRPPVFLVMEHNGGAKSEKPIVLVGKGVTFDTGGISIKPAAGMSEMKADMHGAATVIGAMSAIARLGIKRNVIGLVPATENMPDGSAIVPGDIITYSNGLSVEVDNTDAEGRLILADALIYAQRYAPQAIIDLATLTGACVVALGHVTMGLMGNNPVLIKRLTTAANRTHEYVCELPLYDEYEDLIKSDVADIKNTGGRWAGAITAALFLQRFVKQPSNTPPWAHLDIAGPAILPSDTAYMPKGASGVGVRLLCDVVRHWKK